MQASHSPKKSAVPFANSGTKNTIPVESKIGVTPGLASFTDGFPPLTMTPLAAGGVPPYGADFNGILNFLSSAVRWSQAGGRYRYDAEFAAAVGGYPKGAMLAAVSGYGNWQSLVDNNMADPDGGGGGWVDSTAGRLLNVQVFSTVGTATYVPTDGTRFVVVEVQGGGGAGGGSQATTASTVSVCPGGNAGAYGKSRIASGFSGAVVTVGRGGVGALGENGGSGGTSSFGAHVSAPGGQGSPSYHGQPLSALNINSTPQTSASGANVFNAPGGRGAPGSASSVAYGGSGDGGASIFGSGGATAGVFPVANNGRPGAAPGSGGSGGAGGAGAAASTGGNGASGIVIVWEYA